MKRLKNHVASILLISAFLTSIYWWNRSARRFESWTFDLKVISGTIESKDSLLSLHSHMISKGTKTFIVEPDRGYPLINRRGKPRVRIQPLEFNLNSRGGISTSYSRWRINAKFPYFVIGMVLLTLAAFAFWLERTLIRKRLKT